MHIYRRDIDGLRAVAVIAVCLFHGFPNLLPGGFVGVDVFFVISGYLISAQILGDIRGGTFSFASFYTRRAKRIVPALLVVLLASAGIGWFVCLPSEYVDLSRQILAGLTFASNVLLWHDVGYFDAPATAKPLLHLWSLGVEEQFYIVWPLLMLAGARYWRLASVVIAVMVLSFAWNLISSAHDQSAAFYLPMSRLWELGAGAAIALMGSRPSHIASLAGGALLAAGFVAVHETGFPGWQALLPVAGTALLISSGEASVTNKLLSNRAFVAVGLISYPLYLWHWPLLVFERLHVARSLTVHETTAILGVSGCLAALTYALVERPLKAVKLSRLLRPAAVALATMCLLAAFASAAIDSGGFASRLPVEVQYLDAKLDRTFWRSGLCFHGTSGGVFADQCYPAPKADHLTRAILWGDSHAAALYPGLASYDENKPISIGQLTSASCPPLPGHKDPANVFGCKVSNDAVLAAILQAKPDIVILAASWGDYDLDYLPPLLAKLTASGIGRVVVVGPVPIWSVPPARRLYNAFKADGTNPRRLRPQLMKSLSDLDTKIRAVTVAAGANYISSIDVLCNPEGCLTRVGDQADDLITFDVGHLSVSASKYLIDRIAPRIFPNFHAEVEPRQ